MANRPPRRYDGFHEPADIPATPLKLRAEALADHLKAGLSPIYLIAGDEPLLVQEAGDAIRAAARDAGFADREILFAERGFDWSRLAQAGANLSLFASRQIIELRLPSGRPGRDGAKAIADYAAAPPADTLLLIVAPKLERSSREAAWVKVLAQAGAMVEIWPVERGKLPGWIARRARTHGLELTRDAAMLLAERVEGNLLAAAQEIDKLALLASGGPVDVEAVKAAVAASARYDVFGCVDAALAGDGARALAMLGGLKAEGTEPTLVLWALVRDIRTLAGAGFDAARGRSASRALAGTWARRRQLLEQALRRLGPAACARLLLSAAGTDRVIKGPRHKESWEALAALVAMLAGILPVSEEVMAA